MITIVQIIMMVNVMCFMEFRLWLII